MATLYLPCQLRRHWLLRGRTGKARLLGEDLDDGIELRRGGAARADGHEARALGARAAQQARDRGRAILLSPMHAPSVKAHDDALRTVAISACVGSAQDAAKRACCWAPGLRAFVSAAWNADSCAFAAAMRPVVSSALDGDRNSGAAGEPGSGARRCWAPASASAQGCQAPESPLLASIYAEGSPHCGHTC